MLVLCKYVGKCQSYESSRKAYLHEYIFTCDENDETKLRFHLPFIWYLGMFRCTKHTWFILIYTFLVMLKLVCYRMLACSYSILDIGLGPILCFTFSLAGASHFVILRNDLILPSTLPISLLKKITSKFIVISPTQHNNILQHRHVFTVLFIVDLFLARVPPSCPYLSIPCVLHDTDSPYMYLSAEGTAICCLSSADFFRFKNCLATNDIPREPFGSPVFHFGRVLAMKMLPIHAVIWYNRNHWQP